MSVENTSANFVANIFLNGILDERKNKMSTKNTKLVLVDKRRVNHDNKSVFLVKKTVNTIDYKVGSYLSEQAVRDVMLDVWMTVEIV